MVIVSEEVKIVFIVETNRSIAQIRNFLNNSAFPTMRNRLTTHFQGYAGGAPTVTLQSTDNISAIPGFTNRYEVYPRFDFSFDVPTPETEQDARNRFNNFVEDMKERLRTVLVNVGGNTRILERHYHTADGGSIDTVF